MKKIFISILSIISVPLFAQTYKVPVSEADEPMMTGEYQPNWESLSTYEVPDWFRDAKFGIWAHWGPQCVEGSGDWMARELYMEGTGKANYHRKHYGHPSEVGFKDILPQFKAEHWNPEQLVAFYKEIGAQYFFALGNHHDNFDLWDSKYQEWNSKAIGPHRDILGEWSAAAKKAGLPFGISFHAEHAWTWYEPSRRFDLKGEKRGVKYDGWLTKEDGYKLNADGTEKWWKGLDPQKLYRQDHDFSNNTWDNGAIHSQWAWGNGASLPSVEFATNFYNRTLDAINRYNPDIIYFDATVLPLYPVSDAGLKITTHFYNKTRKASLYSKEEKQTRPTTGVVLGKILDEKQRDALVWDVERGAPNEIVPYPWQCCNCLGDWHYNNDVYRNGSYKSAATVVKLLVDIVSKNGNMLLNVPLRADGTFDEKEEAILLEFGEWMKQNKESIVGTRPWRVFGEGPIANSTIKINAQGFNDGQYSKAGADEIRFTQKGDYIYATALAWPEDMTLTIKNLAGVNKKSIELLGYGKVPFNDTKDAVVITLPKKVNDIAPVLKIKTFK